MGTAFPSAASGRTAIAAEALRFRYATGFELEIERLRLEQGGRLALQGASGSGKSTLLKLVAGILKPDGGRLEVFGTDLSSASEPARRLFRLRTVGFVFQDYPLVESLDALENVLLPLRLVPQAKLGATDVDRARALLEQLDLGTFSKTKPAALSQGERQRVAIARALVNEAPLLLADEPTTGLDPKRAEELLDLLTALQEERKLTILAASHDPLLAERFDEVVSIEALTSEPG